MFVIGCLELSRNDSASYPFDSSIRYFIANFFNADFDSFNWRKYLAFHTFFNFVFERLEHFVNYFWLWWYVIQQQIPKSLIFCIPVVKKFFVVCMFFPAKFLIFCLTFVAIFDDLQGVGCKTEVGSFGICSSNMLLFCSTNLVASKAFINSAFLSLFCDGFQLNYCMILHFYS